MRLTHDPEDGCDACPFHEQRSSLPECQAATQHARTIILKRRDREPGAPEWCPLRAGTVTVERPCFYCNAPPVSTRTDGVLACEEHGDWGSLDWDRER